MEFDTEDQVLLSLIKGKYSFRSSEFVGELVSATIGQSYKQYPSLVLAQISKLQSFIKV